MELCYSYEFFFFLLMFRSCFVTFFSFEMTTFNLSFVLLHHDNIYTICFLFKFNMLSRRRVFNSKPLARHRPFILLVVVDAVVANAVANIVSFVHFVVCINIGN